jgi:hypothetical protein
LADRRPVFRALFLVVFFDARLAPRLALFLAAFFARFLAGFFLAEGRLAVRVGLAALAGGMAGVPGRAAG